MSAYDALQAFVPSLSKRVILSRYPSCAWQECSGLAARQFGALNVLLTLVRLHAGMAIHSYGAYNVGTCAAAILLVHYVSERMMGSIRGSALSAAEVAAFVTFFWMMVQREKYVSKFVASLCTSSVMRALVLTCFRSGITGGHAGGTGFASDSGRALLPGQALHGGILVKLERNRSTTEHG